MPVKIRLQRQGKKGHPYFHIVVADVRAPRDGKYIERLGFYNPNTDPATIEIDVDGAVKWLDNGAQPTDTARAILGYKGVLYKNHLNKGVKKGAFDEAESDKRFNAWLEEKQAKIDGKKSDLKSASTKDAADRMQAEVDKNKERAAAIAAANAPAPVVEEAAEATETPIDAEAQVAESTETPEVIADTPSEEAKAIIGKEPEVTVKEAEEKVAKVDEKAEEAAPVEEPKAEAKEEATAEAQADKAIEAAPVKEAKAEEPKEEPKAGAKAEEPKAEEKEEPKAEAKVEEPKAEEKEEPKAEAAEEPKAEEKEEEKK